MCFTDDDEFAEWNYFNSQTAAGYFDRATDHCVDCLPEFKALMEAEGRCAFPQVTFGQRRTHGGVETVGMREPRAFGRPKGSGKKASDG